MLAWGMGATVGLSQRCVPVGSASMCPCLSRPWGAPTLGYCIANGENTHGPVQTQLGAGQGQSRRPAL